jgi:hypothetical protein
MRGRKSVRSILTSQRPLQENILIQLPATEEHWDRDEERLDYDKDRVEQGFENAPEDVAGWAGRKTQEVEDIPYDVERKWDNGVQDVEDIPEDVAGWAGREDGRVERFDDNVDNAFDQGRDEERYDDDRRDDY